MIFTAKHLARSLVAIPRYAKQLVVMSVGVAADKDKFAVNCH
jgi:hypothetical protein